MQLTDSLLEKPTESGFVVRFSTLAVGLQILCVLAVAVVVAIAFASPKDPERFEAPLGLLLFFALPALSVVAIMAAVLRARFRPSVQASVERAVAIGILVSGLVGASFFF